MEQALSILKHALNNPNQCTKMIPERWPRGKAKRAEMRKEGLPPEMRRCQSNKIPGTDFCWIHTVKLPDH